MANLDWRSWLRFSKDPSTYLGLGMILLVWAGVVFKSYIDRDQYVALATANGSNLVRAFQQSVHRAVGEIDKTLLLIRAHNSNDGQTFNLNALAADPRFASDMIRSIAIIDADGMRILATPNASADGAADASDREQYLVFKDSPVDRLHITKPMLGRVTGKWNVIFARPILTGDGKFQGVVAVAVDPDALTHFFEVVDIGKEGRITLLGLDKAVRAARGGTRSVLGRIIASPVWEFYPQSEGGSFYGQGFDGVRRLVSFQKVDGLPLIALVALSERELLSSFYKSQQPTYLFAAGVTVLIFAGLLIGARHRANFSRAQADIRESTSRALQKSRELEVTLDRMGQGLMMVDASLNVAVINRQAVELLGLPREFLTGQHKFSEVMACLWKQGDFGGDGENLDPKVRDFVKAGGVNGILTYERTRPTGVVLEVRSTALPGGGFVRTFSDVSTRKQSEQRIEHMARHDDLTGLGNRALFRERLDQACARSRRSGELFSVLVLDLDRFKDVNDIQGHPVGDALLKIVAHRLSSSVREVDTVARLGGDEFAVVQTDIHSEDDAKQLGARILDAVRQPYEISGSILEIGTSVGIAVATGEGADAEELLRKADIALYEAKSAGRGSLRVFEAAMEAQARSRHELERDLRRALQNNEFELYYQPMIKLETCKISGVEALLRWNHPKRGTIGPDDFIPTAQEVGIIIEIGEWVLRKACSDATAWPADIKVAVNVSPVQFKDRRLVESVKRILSASGLPPSRLELEITETVIMHDNETNLTALQDLREIGVGIALDDFGTGFSSLSHLRAFPFTKIKIDRSFVQGLGANNSECAAIVRAVADLGRSLGVSTIAEGVETSAQLAQIRAAGCTEIQGYIFSRPVAANEITRVIAQPMLLTLTPPRPGPTPAEKSAA